MPRATDCRVVDGRWLALGMASAVFLFAPQVAATPIEWDAPEGCPDGHTLLARLRQALGVEVIRLGGVSRVRAVVVVGTAAPTPHYRLALELVDGERRSARSFEAEHCEDLARTAAVAISLAVDESSAATETGKAFGRKSSLHVGALLQPAMAIVDAGWSAPDDLPNLPPNPSIARRLIDAWLTEVGGRARAAR